jgi:hypothetical protein
MLPQPEDAAVQVWRYMDLPRLISLLTRNELILPRVDLMIDRFEGSIPSALLKNGGSGSEVASRIALLRAHLRRGVYISSWHENQRESEAMWRLYCGSAEGVALSTTYAKLYGALKRHPNTAIGRVIYIDYQTDDRPNRDGNALAAFTYKRASFEHEREIRVLHWCALDDHVATHAQERSDGLDPSGRAVEAAPAVGLGWDIADTVDHVWVSPYAPRWYFDVVGAVLDRFATDLVGRLEWSEMAAEPWY